MGFQFPYFPNLGLCLQTSITVCAWDDLLPDTFGFYLLVDEFMMVLPFLQFPINVKVTSV